MNIIFNNPFRVLGLPVTASPRQISKRVHDLSMLSEFGQVPEYAGDLSFIADIDRSPESIERAAHDLELPERKLHFANFWFWIDNSIDELVMDLLRDGDFEKALSLWGRSIENKDISARTISNYRNHTLLALIGSGLSAPTRVVGDTSHLRDFVQKTVHVLSDAAYLPYAARIAGKTYEVQSDTQLIKFADEVAAAIFSGTDSHAVESVKFLIGSFSTASQSVQRHVTSKFTAQRIRKIENLIEAVSAARARVPELAYEEGMSLYRACEPEIAYLRRLLSTADPYIASISDKVAAELLNCSTVYYNAADDMDVGLKRSKQLSECAKTFALGLRAKKRVADDLALIGKLEKDHRLTVIVEQIKAELERVPSFDRPLPLGVRTVESIKRLLANTKAPLNSLRAQSGDGSVLYEQFGSLVARLALAMCIRFANETNDCGLLIPLIQDIEPLPMSVEQRAHFNSNKHILQQNVIVESLQRASTPLSKGGCYIATLVYGGADEPAVAKLRWFRDSVLLQSARGRKFVKFYYRVAPTLVLWLQHAPCVQRVVRKSLDYFIRRFP